MPGGGRDTYIYREERDCIVLKIMSDAVILFFPSLFLFLNLLQNLGVRTRKNTVKMKKKTKKQLNSDFY